MLHWPTDAARREELAADGVPRLLLVGPDDPPPARLERDEDWIRVPADEQDLWARLESLRRRRRPRLSDDGRRLVVDGRSLTLSDAEATVLTPLLERFGELVHWHHLGGPQKQIAGRLSRLRKRLVDVGLVIHRVRGQGALLDRDGD
jgi:DNA-binding response OmpR family regulator